MTKPFPECHAQPYTGNKIKRNTTALFQTPPSILPFSLPPPVPSSTSQSLYAAVRAWRVRAPRCLELSLTSCEALGFSTASSASVRISSMWQGLDM